jgi:hypothetical protein
MFGEYSEYTMVSDVDEYIYARGGLLNKLAHWQAKAGRFCEIIAPYNWWVRDNQTIAQHEGDSSEMYIGKLNRYFLDPGCIVCWYFSFNNVCLSCTDLGKYIICNALAVRLKIHHGICSRSNSRKVPQDLVLPIIRANHHRHGAFSDSEAISHFKERESYMESAPGVWKEVYGVIQPCFSGILAQYLGSVPLDPSAINQAGEGCFLKEKEAHYPTTNTHLYSP